MATEIMRYYKPSEKEGVHEVILATPQSVDPDVTNDVRKAMLSDFAGNILDYHWTTVQDAKEGSSLNGCACISVHVDGDIPENYLPFPKDPKLKK